jgi:integrase
MPIEPIPPREGKTPYWYGRGTYLGIYVNRSTKASKRALAVKIIATWQQDIERGELTTRGEPTFASAATAYMIAGGERRFLTPILRHIGEKPLRFIDQAEIDSAATAIFPTATPATRNRQLYTPISAVLKHAGIDAKMRRPKGAGGNKATAWLWPEQTERMFAEAEKLDPEFAILLILLCYTGMRLSESLSLQVSNVRLGDSFAYVSDSKNGEPRPVFLPPVVVAALANHPRGLERAGAVFRFRKSGHLYSLLRAVAARSEVDLPERSAFHIFCHTYATWMRRYGGLDTRGLVATGRWKDRKSADRYEHVVVSEESMRATMLPTPKPKKA